MYSQLLQDFPLSLSQPQNKPLCNTGDSQDCLMVRILQDDSIFQRNMHPQFHITDMNFVYQDSQSVVNDPVGPPLKQQETAKPKKKQVREKKEQKKNSNVVKKMGRLILTHIDQYKIGNGQNEGVITMQEMLRHKFASNNCKSKSKCLADGFNTSHLQALFSARDRRVVSFNLKTTRRIFTKLLREQVRKSIQIKGDQAKLLYLNTLKCGSLRLMNQKLASRLQASWAQR